MKRIVLRLGPESPENVSWAVVDDDGRQETGAGSLQEAADAADRLRTTVLVPAGDVLLVEAMIPKGSRQRIAQAIPYAVEEQYICEAEEMHFSQGDRSPDGILPLALVSVEQMDGWTSMLQEAGIDFHSMMPDVLAIPYHPGDFSVLIEGEMALVRTGLQQGFAVDVANLEKVLKGEFDGKEASGSVTVHLYSAPGRPVLSAESLAPHILVESPLADVISLLVEGVDDKPIFNLLQGRYNRHAIWETLWTQWRVPLILLLLFCVLRGGLMVQNYAGLSRESRDLTGQIESVYRTLFPDAKKVVNPRAQLEHRLSLLRSQGEGGHGFSSLLQKITGTLLETPGFAIQNMRFKTDRLDLSFFVGSLQGLDALKERLTGIEGVSVDIRTATAKGDKVEARMQIKGGGK